jgi:tRNA A37 threonylcarbamoyladenosine dehydratase
MDPLRAKILEERAKNIVKQMQIYEMNKNSHKEISKQLLSKDPDYLY